MRFTRVVGLVALTGLICTSLPAHVAAQSEWPNCENFLDQADVQSTYDADRADPFGLESSEPINDVPCEDEPAFGTEPLVSCDALTANPEAQQALQGLYDHTRDQGDPYGLDQGGDPAVACDSGGGGGDEQEMLDGPPPERGGNDQEALDGSPSDSSPDDEEELNGPSSMTSRGTTVVVSSTPLDDFDALGTRLDARFAALEAQFAAFEVRAENGFGRFDEVGDDAPTDGQGPTVVVSTSREPAAVMQSVDATDAGTQAVLAQRVRDGVTIEGDPSSRLKARKDSQHERNKERKSGKHHRHKDKQRNRR